MIRDGTRKKTSRNRVGGSVTSQRVSRSPLMIEVSACIVPPGDIDLVADLVEARPPRRRVGGQHLDGHAVVERHLVDRDVAEIQVFGHRAGEMVLKLRLLAGG